jgi:predicted regulator of Ras-like GTPase activity (Roadblock/LC7/MglB family)
VNTAPPSGAALEQLSAVPGVVGSLVFDTAGAVVASVFPPVFDPGGLRTLAERLSTDGYFQEWMAGDNGALELRYVDGNVLVRTVDRSWLLVLCTAQTNAQLLSMSLTQVVRRLRASVPKETAPAAPTAPPSVLERLRAVVAAELGTHAAQALEMLNAAGPKPKDLARAAADVEKLTRLFIDKRKAEEIGRMMREILGR